MISMKNICDFAGSNPSQRKFVEGERVYKAGHVIKCGKNLSNSDSSTISFTAVCLQTSNLRESPHEINGKVLENGDIIECSCSCKAGLGEKCKHVIAVLLYIYQKGDQLESLSCTDKKCEWKQVHNKALENYIAAPLMQHSCYANPVKKKKIINAASITHCYEEPEEEIVEDIEVNESQPDVSKTNPKPKRKSVSESIDVSELQQQRIASLINDRLPMSALAKHAVGRHDPIVVKDKSKVRQAAKDVINVILENQYSELMQSIKMFQVDIPNKCCSTTLEQLSHDLQRICEDTQNHYAEWMKERLCRITGSICYGLYTYTKKKRSKDEWIKKCESVFSPKDFKTESTEHGKLTESEARNAFRKVCNSEIMELGLIVSKQNPWLAYSPDGVLVRNKKPTALLEIKCPLKGKTANIQETVDSQMQKSLTKEGENIVMKEKHAYYGQVQLGMAVLNLNMTYFVIYSSFDKSLFTLRVRRNDIFIATMLKALKNVYYSLRLHQVCALKGNCDTSDSS